jgi:hypothetical protein
MSEHMVRQMDDLMEQQYQDDDLVNRLQDRIDELKEQVATLQRDNAALAKTIFDGSGCTPDHIGPIEGYCFMGLNFTPEQFSKVSVAILDRQRGKSADFFAEEVIVEIIEEAIGRPLETAEDARSAGIEES